MSPSAAAAARRRWSGTWQEVIRQIPSDDPNMVGKLVFEDPDLADTRMLRSMRAEGKFDAVLFSLPLGAYDVLTSFIPLSSCVTLQLLCSTTTTKNKFRTTREAMDET